MYRKVVKSFLYAGAFITVLFLRGLAEKAGLSQYANPAAFVSMMVLVVLFARTWARR